MTASVSSIDQLKRRTFDGAAWTIALGTLSIPTIQLRNWLLGNLEEGASLAGIFAVCLIFQQVVSTFFVFGAPTVSAYFLPREAEQARRAEFIWTTTYVSLVLLALYYVLRAVYPHFLAWTSRHEVSAELQSLLDLMVPMLFVHQLLINTFTGLLRFRASAILQQSQVVLTTVVLGVLFLGRYELDYEVTIPWIWAGVLGGTTLLALVTLLPALGWPVRPSLPRGFWRYAVPAQFNTVATFCFNSLDQLFVLAAVSLSELGAYFLATQIASLIVFVPRRLFQVLLAAFSKMVNDQRVEATGRAYHRILHCITAASFLIAGLMIVSASPLMTLLGCNGASAGIYLALLALIGYATCLGSTNAMLLMAMGRSFTYSTVNFVVVATQIVTMLGFLSLADTPHEKVLAIIGGRAAGTLVGQIGLWTAMYLSSERGWAIAFPYKYLIGLVWLSLILGLQLASIPLVFVGLLLVVGSIVLTPWSEIQAFGFGTS